MKSPSEMAEERTGTEEETKAKPAAGPVASGAWADHDNPPTAATSKETAGFVKVNNPNAGLKVSERIARINSPDPAFVQLRGVLVEWFQKQGQ